VYVAVVYDIVEDRRRARLAAILQGYGQRIQRSLFECDLEERHFMRLLRELTDFVEPGDDLRIYRFPQANERNVLILGGLPLVRRPSIIVV
jgi:CRISPR-associated protein Cas2